MPRELKPTAMAPPAAAYAHGVQVPAGHELIVTSGVVPTRIDGSVPANIDEQANVVWQNIFAILADGNMGAREIVSVTTYVVHSTDSVVMATRLKLVMSARDAALDGHLAASTLVTVPALARPEWLVEIAVLAARQPNS